MIEARRKWACLFAAGFLSSTSVFAQPNVDHRGAAPGRAVIDMSANAPCPPAPCPPDGSQVPYGTYPPSMTGTNTGAGSTMTETGQTPLEDLLASSSSMGFYSGNLTAAGTGLTSATNAVTAQRTDGSRGFASSTTSSRQIPLILPGLFTAITVQSARPVNRLSVDYGYYDQFKAQAGGVQSGFNLHSFNIGGEYAFLGDSASLYFRVPFLNAVQNTTGQKMDGFGDVSLGIKYAILADRLTGSTLSAGLTVALPTAPDLVAVTNTYAYDPGSASAAARGNTILAQTQSEKINPTFWQPYLSGVYVLDQLALQGYLGVIVPSDDRVATYTNANLGASYNVYQNSEGWLSSITPSLNAQALMPLTNRGSGAMVTPANIQTQQYAGTPVVLPPNSPQRVSLRAVDQVFLSPGCQFGIGRAAQFSLSVILPVTGPNAYSVGGTCGLNFFY